MASPTYGTTRRIFYLAITAIAAPTLAGRVCAQAPASAVRAIFAAIDSSDWSRVVSLAHPEALKRFHAEQVHLARIVDDARANPSIPAELREAKPFYQRLYKVESAEQLDAMPAAVMLGYYLRRRNQAFVLKDSVKDTTPSLPRIVGTVSVGDSLAYVVFIRPGSLSGVPDSLAPVETQNAEVMTLMRDAGAWRVMLDGGVVWGSRGFIAFSDDDR